MTVEGHEPPERLKRIDEFTLADLEAVRLVLRGDSVIDWHRLNLQTDAEVLEFLRAQEFRPEEPADRSRMAAIKNEAVSYLRRQFEYPIPKPVAQATVERAPLHLASGSGHRQMCACTILKCMHIIHHLEGRELLFMLPFSDQEVFHNVEEKIYRVIGSMLAHGFPITEFIGGRKNKDSLYTKLLSKQETVAAQIYDKLRFRVVTRSAEDIFPVIQFLTKRLFPYNYVIPAQSINSIFHFRNYCLADPHLAPMLPSMQAGADDETTPTDNRFSAATYRVIHFVVDMPVRLPRLLLERAPSSAWPLGPVIFVVCEFQIIDRNTEAANEQGEASHAKYKERQKRAVMRRLQLGMREMKIPPGASHPESASQIAVAPAAPSGDSSAPPPTSTSTPAQGSTHPPGEKKKR